jgi:glyoxylase-like metal-dependent hydrolase (beta-lactamase superfamily II)
VLKYLFRALFLAFVFKLLQGRFFQLIKMRTPYFSVLLFAIGSQSCSHTELLTERFAKLPAAVKGGPSTAGLGYGVQHLGAGTYMVTDGGYQAMFVVSSAGVIVVDNPPTIGKNMLYAVGNVTDKPITHLVYSHAHADHIGSASILVNKDTQIIAHKETKELLKLVNDPLRPLPTKTFTDDYNLTVGNQTLQLSYKGENHSRGNIYIYAKVPKVLMLVDVIYPGWAPFSGLAVSSNIPGWIEAHNQVLKYDFKYYIGGHLGRVGNKSDVAIQRDYVQDLFTTCKKAIDLTATADPEIGANSILDPIGKLNPGNPWAQFKGYLDITAEYCGNKTLARWIGRLGAADVFAFENAYKMVEHLRLDYNVLGPFRNV